MRVLFVWIICVSVTLIALSLSYVGILTHGLWRNYQAMSPDMMGPVVFATLLPLFFLCFMLAVCVCLLVWSVKRLFKPSATLPDFM